MSNVRYLGLIAFCLVFAAPARADLESDLRELKKICDDGLLTSEECATRRGKILERHDHESIEWFCNYGGELSPPNDFSGDELKEFSESASASAVVKEILDNAGLAPNFIVRPANVPNAAASARGGQRYVEYSPTFITQLKSGTGTNWAVYSVMAHEIGHHLQGHTLTNTGSRPPIELEADEYSGFILAKLGASLVNSQKAMKTFGSDSGSTTHPARNDRLKAIAKGWNRANAKAEPQPMPPEPEPSPAPIPAPPQPTMQYTDSCIVNGEPVLIATTGVIVSRARGYMQVGQRVPPAHPNCMFDMLSNAGRYCVDRGGRVFFGTPVPVGMCQPCAANMCN